MNAVSRGSSGEEDRLNAEYQRSISSSTYTDTAVGSPEPTSTGLVSPYFVTSTPVASSAQPRKTSFSKLAESEYQCDFFLLLRVTGNGQRLKGKSGGIGFWFGVEVSHFTLLASGASVFGFCFRSQAYNALFQVPVDCFVLSEGHIPYLHIHSWLERPSGGHLQLVESVFED